jgi:hypothetical protein
VDDVERRASKTVFELFGNPPWHASVLTNSCYLGASRGRCASQLCPAARHGRTRGARDATAFRKKSLTSGCTASDAHHLNVRTVVRCGCSGNLFQKVNIAKTGCRGAIPACADAQTTVRTGSWNRKPIDNVRRYRIGVIASAVGCVPEIATITLSALSDFPSVDMIRGLARRNICHKMILSSEIGSRLEGIAMWYRDIYCFILKSPSPLPKWELRAIQAAM